jgi:replicative DNA helicase
MPTDCPKLPPHDLDIEHAVLSAILFDPSALSQALEYLKASDFYDSRHQRIFTAMAELTGSGGGLDLLTLGDHLERAGTLALIGGRGALAEWLTTIATASNIGHHAEIVREHSVRRRLIRLADTMSQRAYSKADSAELLQEAQREIHALATSRETRTWVSLAELACDTVLAIDQVSKRSTALVGIPTGFASLNSLLSGWQKSDLVIIAARPSMGKTAFALGSALAAATAGHRVGFISIEMSRQQVGLRLHSMGAPIDVHALRTGSLSPQGWTMLAATAQRFESLPFWIDDSCVLTVEQIAAKARQLQATHGLDLLIVDYLQLVHMDRADNRTQGVTEASRQLKLLAKELDIPVLVLSQLSRNCEQRPDKRPLLSDLRDSGSIEQDADVVLFLYREEMYTKDTEESGMAEILVRKHRNGPTGDRTVRFAERYARFDNLEPSHPRQSQETPP